MSDETLKEKRNIQTLADTETKYLNSILDSEDVNKFKDLVPELQDTWSKKQMFRTETEMRFSVLNDAKYPTKAAKYWQSVREQNTHFENLMHLSFEYRKNDIEIEKLKAKIEKEDDPLEIKSLTVDLEEKQYGKGPLIPILGPGAEKAYDLLEGEAQAFDYFPVYSQLDTRALER